MAARELEEDEEEATPRLGLRGCTNSFCAVRSLSGGPCDVCTRMMSKLEPLLRRDPAASLKADVLAAAAESVMKHFEVGPEDELLTAFATATLNVFFRRVLRINTKPAGGLLPQPTDAQVIEALTELCDSTRCCAASYVAGYVV